MIASAVTKAAILQRSAAAACAGLSLLLAACAGSGGLPSLGATGSLNPPLPAPTAAAAGGSALPATSDTSQAPPATEPAGTGGLGLSLGSDLAHGDIPPLEAYARLVRHSRGCWFGLDGLIEASHVLHADALPPEQGGRVVITIHDRVVGGKSIWGARAFEITLAPVGEGSSLALANIKLPDPIAAAMSRDVEAWVRDRAGCGLRAAMPSAATAGPPLPVRRPSLPTDRQRVARKRR